MTEPLTEPQAAPACPLLSFESIVWVAGVIDARGHIEISDRHDKPQPRVTITTRRITLLDRLAQLTGTKVSADDRGYSRRPCTHHCTDQHVHVVRQSSKWRVDSARALVVLAAVQPYVVAQRDEVAEAIAVGLRSWPAARGNTGAQMAALGWPLPVGA